MSGEETSHETGKGDETKAIEVNVSREGSKHQSAGDASSSKGAGGSSVRTPTSGSYKKKG